MKRFLLIFMLCIAVNVVCAQEVRCKVVSPSPFYKGVLKPEYMGDLKLDDIIIVRDFCNFVFTDYVPNPRREFLVLFNEEYWGYPQNLIPVETDALFDQDVLTDTATFLFNEELLCKEMWIPIHCVDALRSKDREILLKYEPDLIKYNDYDMDGIKKWYDYGYEILDNEMIIFFNPIIYSLGGKFLIKNVKKHENVYTVECFAPSSLHHKLVPPSKLMPYFNWSLCTDDIITMILYVDGEYMDIYINEIKPYSKFGTIVRIKEEFIRQFMNLIRKNECDLSKVHFPRRADGSMDYPPPVLSTDTNNTEETENTDDSAIAEFSKEKSAKEGLGFKIILIAGIAALLGGGVTVFVIKRKV